MKAVSPLNMTSPARSPKRIRKKNILKSPDKKDSLEFKDNLDFNLKELIPLNQEYDKDDKAVRSTDDTPNEPSKRPNCPRRSKRGTKCYTNPFQKQKQFQLLESLIDNFEKHHSASKLQHKLNDDIQKWDDKVLKTFQEKQNIIMNHVFDVQDKKVKLKRQRLNCDFLNKKPTQQNIPVILPLSSMLSVELT